MEILREHKEVGSIRPVPTSQGQTQAASCCPGIAVVPADSTESISRSSEL